jgi:hypothetical protein
MLGLATKILNDYGKVLGQLEPGTYGLPISFLPHSKEQIRAATKHVLDELGPGQPTIREALIRGFVYLAQFVPDEEAEVLLATPTDGTGIDDDQSAEAVRIINRIKLDMERSLEEIAGVGAGKVTTH